MRTGQELGRVNITVKYFASLRDACGKSEETVRVEDGMSVSGLRSLLLEMYPSLDGVIGNTYPVVNMEYIQDDRSLQDGDEVTFIPPVSGG
jgi:molybdopterin converting factor subunit 1